MKKFHKWEAIKYFMLFNVNNLTGCRLLSEISFNFMRILVSHQYFVDGKTFDVFLIKVSTVKLIYSISFN